MSALRILVVDDEPPAVELLASLVSEVDDFSVVATAHDVPSARKILEHEAIDLVLLDIAMPGEDGFALIEQIGLDRMPFVIFITAHGDHALRAFDVRALDYLLKPPTVARFRSALERAADLIRTKPARDRQPRLRELIQHLERNPQAGASANHFDPASEKSAAFVSQIVIRTRDSFEKIPVESIIWCEAQDHYVKIHTLQKSYLYTGNLSSLGKQLDPEAFARVRRDAIVRYGAIESVAIGTFGTLQLHLSKKHSLRTSRTLDASVKLRCLAHVPHAQ